MNFSHRYHVIADVEGGLNILVMLWGLVMLDVTDIYTKTHIHVISRTLIRDVMIELKQLLMKILILHLSSQEALYGH